MAVATYQEGNRDLDFWKRPKPGHERLFPSECSGIGPTLDEAFIIINNLDITIEETFQREHQEHRRRRPDYVSLIQQPALQADVDGLGCLPHYTGLVAVSLAGNVVDGTCGSSHSHVRQGDVP